MNKRLLVLLDLDSTVAVQPSMTALLQQGEAVRLDARDLAPRLRIVASARAARSLTARLRPIIAGRRPLIFYGSGDFHHLTALFLALQPQPLTVLHFDNHPDWTAFPPSLNCGGWVSRALARPGVEQVITIGPTSDDLHHPELKWANLRALREGRHEVYPWRPRESPFWGRRLMAAACRSKGWTLRWDGLAGSDLAAFAEALATRLAGHPLWITLDKDVLCPGEAVTNWDQGGMTLDAVLTILDRVTRVSPVLGADVCGDASPPRFADPFRWLLSATDRAAKPPPTAAELALNDRVNSRIAEAFGGYLA